MSDTALTILAESNDTIIDPTTGEVIDRKNVDQLAEAYGRIDAAYREMGDSLKSIRMAFAELSYGDARTRRVRGERHRVRLEMPANTWNQKKLREAWDDFPAIAQEFIRIERLAPKLREVKKIQEESGPRDFLAFRKLLLEAEEPSNAPPRVTLESDTETERAEQEWALRGALKASLGEGGER